MSDVDRNKKTDCQLGVVYEAGVHLTLSDRIRNISLRLMSALRRRIHGGNEMAEFAAAGRSGVGVDDNVQQADDSLPADVLPGRQTFRIGEMIRIRPFDEIRKTLDANGRCEGLQFMLGMRKYCGQKARVLKPIRTIFDERLWKMVKIRNAYLLEGIICDGRDVFDGEGCDRSCYFFWKDKWLRKIEE